MVETNLCWVGWKHLKQRWNSDSMDFNTWELALKETERIINWPFAPAIWCFNWNGLNTANTGNCSKDGLECYHSEISESMKLKDNYDPTIYTFPLKNNKNKNYCALTTSGSLLTLSLFEFAIIRGCESSSNSSDECF